MGPVVVHRRLLLVHRVPVRRASVGAASLAAVAAVVLHLVWAPAFPARCDDRLARGLAAHWPLVEDGRDASGNGLDAQSQGVAFGVGQGDSRASAVFNGRGAFLSAPADRLALGTQDFSIAAWMQVDESLKDAPGDLLSQYSFADRRGFHLALKTNSGVTFSLPNWRHLQFAIDHRQSENAWKDHGRPGNALLAFALAVHEDRLYAGVCQPGEGESGRVFRLDGDDHWIDCGAPDKSNSVTALAEFEGRLYAGTGKYRVAGSALPESPNIHTGGRVFRYEGGDRWTDVGQLAGVDALGGLAVFGGRLYATSLYKPAGFFRYEQDGSWTACPTPGEARVEALCPFDGHLYATSYDGGKVFRFDGENWEDCGQLGEPGLNTQTYAFAIFGGRLYAGTWPSGRVYRFESPHHWTDCGRLGEELEVMGMLTHNGRLIAGSLPLAEVYEFDGDRAWTRLARLDHTPDVRYRRAWTMAEYGGRLFCSTLPSGHIYSYAVGRVAMAGRPLPGGWRHVAAIKAGGRLKLFVDGALVAESAPFNATDYDLSSSAPLLIGAGPNDFFAGRLSDVRIYVRALEEAELRSLVEARP